MIIEQELICSRQRRLNQSIIGGKILEKSSIGDIAPDFSLPDPEGKPVCLSELNQHHHVLLVFNIGFVCSKSASQTALHQPYGTVAP
ncbi:MAG: hypothetical protein ACNA70_04875 [Brevefilum sp.]